MKKNESLHFIQNLQNITYLFIYYYFIALFLLCEIIKFSIILALPFTQRLTSNALQNDLLIVFFMLSSVKFCLLSYENSGF